jgi:hypothetical protein
MYYVDILFNALPNWTPIPPLVLCHKIIPISMNDQTRIIIFKPEDLQINYHSVKKDIHTILNELPAPLRDFEKYILVELQMKILYVLQCTQHPKLPAKQIPR